MGEGVGAQAKNSELSAYVRPMKAPYFFSANVIGITQLWGRVSKVALCLAEIVFSLSTSSRSTRQQTHSTWFLLLLAVFYRP